MKNKNQSHNIDYEIDKILNLYNDYTRKFIFLMIEKSVFQQSKITLEKTSHTKGNVSTGGVNS